LLNLVRKLFHLTGYLAAAGRYSFHILFILYFLSYSTVAKCYLIFENISL